MSRCCCLGPADGVAVRAPTLYNSAGLGLPGKLCQEGSLRLAAVLHGDGRGSNGSSDPDSEPVYRQP